MATKKKANGERAVVVTTKSKGVFFGYTDQPLNSKEFVLKRARMCVYWSRDVRGVMGLGEKGPTDSCKITPAAPEWAVNEVTGCMTVSDAARDAWERAPWA